MKRRKFLERLRDAAVGVAAAATIACLIHLAWIVASLIIYCVLVLAGLICGYVPDISAASQVFGLVTALLAIVLGVCGVVFVGAMFWGFIFTPWGDVKK